MQLTFLMENYFYICAIIFALFCLFVTIYIFINKKKEFVGFKMTTIAIAVLVGVFLVTVIDFAVMKDSANLKEQIEEYYKITFLDKIDGEDINKLKEGLPTNPIMGKIDGDENRIYEFYLIEDPSTKDIKLYSRNEKGVYLPITKITTQITSNNSTDNINGGTSPEEQPEEIDNRQEPIENGREQQGQEEE